MGIAMVLGIAPALLLMYYGVRDYTFPRVEQPFFSDPSFFMLFVAGMIEGSIMFLLMLVFLNTSVSNIIIMALLAIVQVMVFVVTMNLKRYRGKSDSVFYGYGLGLGTSCGMATGLCFTLYSSIVSSDTGFDASVVILVLMSFSFAFILSSCGTTVGEGVARHRVMEFALQAMIPLVAVYMLFGVAVGEGNDVLFYLYFALMTVIGAVYYYFIMRKKLPSVVREVLRLEGNRRKDVPRRSRPVEARARLADEPARQHRGQHLLRPGAGGLLQVPERELPLDGGEALGEDLHLLVHVARVLVAVHHGGPRVRLLDAAPLGLLLGGVGAERVCAGGLCQRLADGVLVLGLEVDCEPRGPVRAPAVGAGGRGLGEVGHPRAAAGPALGQAVAHLYPANTRAARQQP